jgi:hypothetical protein
MVRGILSPVSLTRNTTNCPGLAFRAIRGASIFSWQTVFSAISLFSRILYTFAPLLFDGISLQQLLTVRKSAHNVKFTGEAQ